jgi:hypothetical protein
MDVLTWTGTGGGRTLSGLAFSPDLVWGKSRSAAYNHQLYDVVRGAGNANDLSSSLTAAEGSATVAASQYGYLSAFTSDGFTVANGTDGSLPGAYWNASGTTYAAWAWDAGSSTDTNNTAGTITPTGVRANATAGFSVVTWSYGTVDATVGHGLGVAPGMIIAKARTGTSQWIVYHSALGADKYIYLSTTGAAATNIAGVFSGNSSTVFEVNAGLFPASVDYVAYCFAPVVGYSSAFSISGNGSVDGPFCFLGFRPRFLIYKRTDVSGDRWLIWDAARNSYNQMTDCLFPNLSNAELNGYDIDFLSNGFKLRDLESAVNASGGTYIGFAWAESPFNYARAR